MKHLSILILALSLTACSTAQKINFEKLKEDDRVYTGKVDIQLNGQDNKNVVCDIFLNIDLNPVFRISENGLYYFKTTRKNLGLGKVACLQTVNGEKKWIYHDFDVKKIKRAEDNTTITSLGTLKIDWKFDQEALQKPATRFADDTVDRIENVGKFKVEFKPNLAEQTQFMQNTFSELKDPKYKFVEKLFIDDSD